MTSSRRHPSSGENAPIVALNIVTKRIRAAWRLAPCALALLATSCGALNSASNAVGSVLGNTPKAQPGTPGFVQGFLGGVVADEPRAATAGRDVLSSGGNAMDAAVAVGLVLAVTLPSRAGLGGGGACVAYSPNPKKISGGRPEAVLFLPGAPKSGGGGGDRPAATPMLARGMYFLHSRYGSVPFETLVQPAEQFARAGVPVSRALVRDLAAVSGPLAADPNSRAVFVPGGVPLAEGALLIQPALGATLAQLRVAGVGDMYQGTLARRVETGYRLSGGPMTQNDLRDALPTLAATLDVAAGADSVSFLPPPADGGLAAVGAFQVLVGKPPGSADAADARGLALASRWRDVGGDPLPLLASTDLAAANLPVLPASTSFLTVDRDGNAVACALTLNNLFGTGRMLPGIGYIAAASPASVPPPLLAAAIAWNQRKEAFRAAVAGSGQEGSSIAVASTMAQALSGAASLVPPPEPGRANVITCRAYLPDGDKTCLMVADPRGSGLALGGG
jgi:gamma-glutamyltranspeptidase/glutathione hydrolase